MASHSLQIFKSGKNIRTLEPEDFKLKLLDSGNPQAEDPVRRYDGDWNLGSVDSAGFSIHTTKGTQIKYRWSDF